VLQQVDTTGEYDGEIEMLGTGEVLTDADIEAIQKQLIHMYDAQEVLYRSVNAKGKAAEQIDNRRGVLLGSRVLNSLETEYATNTQLQELQRSFEDLRTAKTPEQYRIITESIKEGLSIVGDLNEEDEEEEELVEGVEGEEVTTGADVDAASVDDITMPGTDEMLSQWDTIIEALEGDYGTGDELVQAALEAIGESNMEFAQTEQGDAFFKELTKVYAEDIALNGEEQEAGWIMVPMERGGHQLTPVQMKESAEYDDETQEWTPTMVPDIASLGEGAVALMEEMKLDINEMPTARVPGAEGVERVTVLPRMQNYPGVKFLIWGDPDNGGARIDETSEGVLNKLGILSEDVSAGNPLSEELINKITGDPNIVDTMIRRGQLVETGWPVLTFESGGDTWYMDKLVTDEGEQVYWYKDALPFVGRIMPTDQGPLDASGNLRDPIDRKDHFNAGHFGATVGANSVIWIDYNPEEGDYDDAGVGSPFIDVGISAEQARKDTVAQGGVPASTYVRDPLNPTQAVVIGADNPRHYMNPSHKSLNEWLNDQQTIKNQVADKMAERLTPEQAAEIAFLDPLEFDEWAFSMDINPNNAEDIVRGGGSGGAPGGALGPVLGEELGITPGSEEEEVEPAETFDHNAAARSGAMGVAAANAADRAAKVAAAAAAKAQATAASSIPRIKPASATTNTGASSYKPKTPAGTPPSTSVPEQQLPNLPGGSKPPASTAPPSRTPTPGTGRTNF